MNRPARTLTRDLVRRRHPPLKLLTTASYRFRVSGFGTFERKKASHVTTGSLPFGWRILSRIPTSQIIAPRVGLYAGQARDLGVHVDHLIVIAPLGYERQSYAEMER